MRTIAVELRDDGVAVVTLDDPDRAVNTLSPALLDEFEAKVSPLLDDPAVRGLVLVSGKADTFIAGADLDLVATMDEAAASELSRRGNALLERVARASTPVVAAVHGAALGGGLEVVLACHYIVASDDPKTVLALPEVTLGLLPGGGGTQRLPRRVGLRAALPLLLTGKRLRARRARRIGLVDAVTTPGGIGETGARAALALAEGRLRRSRPRLSLVDRLAARWPLRSIVLGQARAQVERRTRGLYPAPPAILDCVETGLRKGIAAGLARESELFGRLVASPESRALVWLFDAMNEAKRRPTEGARPVRRLAIVGGGFMGAGVASVSLGLCPVTVRDLSDEVLGRAARTVRTGLDKQRRSGAVTTVEADRRWSRLELTTDVDDVRGADLVVEAVFEELELKCRVLAEVEQRVAPEAVIGSNTSALPIAAIAAEAAHPERVLGMHYFSPVPRMPLLEIVVAERTAEAAVATAVALGVRQGKTPIVVKDGPGFYTTRILAPYLNEAIVLLEEGAPVDLVDRAMKDFGFPVGPLALLDEVGIDVGAHVAEDLGRAFAERGLGASDALPRMVEAGFLGRKGRRGFYLYPKPKKRAPRPVDPRVYEFFGGPERRPVAAAAIVDRLALMMVNETAHCLGEEIVASPRDADLGAVLGLGFPPFRGGPLHWVDAVGPAEIVARLCALAERHGPRFEPAPRLVAAAEGGERFFPASG